MRLAILMANTDESTFAQAHPDDGEKFTALIRVVRPNWTFDVFSVKDGVFPPTLNYDGLLITGSPASVHDGMAWINRLEALIRQAVTNRVPMFGACFGHQIIAQALGGTVSRNPDGWVLGRVETIFVPDGRTVPIYAAHKEQVTILPENAKIIATTSGCEVAGFSIENHILTTQYHPEMSKEFIAALLEAFADEIGHDVTLTATQTLKSGTDMTALAEWIAAFFEQAQPQMV